MEEHLLHALEIKTTIHPIEDGTAQHQAQCHLHYVVDGVSLLHIAYKSNAIQWNNETFLEK